MVSFLRFQKSREITIATDGESKPPDDALRNRILKRTSPTGISLPEPSLTPRLLCISLAQKFKVCKR